ncbi:hypothetical protein [Lutibaculum baratangense]|uniref:Chaperone protein DnaJ n=1 Tax=Lutibaculum baratangense AMV1 TaxID=631454 RepID=V4TMN7_9HYPH|nr:hypothetical protein [Lutibaculum baratangense]ESR27008.1 hypothetical protein N177_0434 [Lutibaculum baratangense AMV1]
MTDDSRRNPGDEDAPGSRQSAKNVCLKCGGTGRLGGEDCAACGGEGFVTEIVGDA